MRHLIQLDPGLGSILTILLGALSLAACFSPIASPPPPTSQIRFTTESVEERIAHKFEIHRNTNYLGTVCAQHEPSILAALTELADVPLPQYISTDKLRQIFAQAAQIEIDQFERHEYGFLIGLPGCRHGSHDVAGTHFYAASWRRPAQKIGWGRLHILQQQMNRWVIVIDTKRSTASGPTPYNLVVVDWEASGWHKIEHSLSPMPYRISKAALANDGAALTVLASYWWAEMPCTLTKTFTKAFFLYEWHAQLTYKISRESIQYQDRQIISWDLRKDGKLYKGITDWQQYCVELSQPSARSSGSGELRGLHIH